MSGRRYVVWHPDSPGMQLIVCRKWWQPFRASRKFATLRECGLHYDWLADRRFNIREDLTARP